MAIVGAIQAVTSFALTVARLSLFEQLEAGEMGELGTASDAVWEQIDAISTLSLGLNVVLELAFVAAAFVFASSFRAGRRARWAWVGASLYCGYFLLWAGEAVYQRVGEPDFELSTGVKLFWLSVELLATGGLFGLLAAAVDRSAPDKSAHRVLGRVALAVFGGLRALLLAFAIASWFVLDSDGQRALSWPFRLTALVSYLAFVGVCGWVAHTGPGTGSGAATAIRKDGLNGGPLRLLAGASVTRMVVGVALGAVAVIGMRSGGVGGLAMLAIALSTGCGLAVIAALVLQLTRWPSEARSEGALGAAVAMIGLGLLLDAWVGFSTVRLLGLVAEARSASSMWGMPNLSEIRDLQAVVAWGGRGAQLLGVGSVVAILVSLTQTAEYAEDYGARSNATMAMGLAVTATVLFMLVGLLATEVSRDERMLLVAGALFSAALAFAFLVLYLQTIVRLARAMDAVGLSDEVERGERISDEEE